LDAISIMARAIHPMIGMKRQMTARSQLNGFLRERVTIPQRQETYGDMTLRNLVTPSGVRIMLQ
jgi:hypothetical protein